MICEIDFNREIVARNRIDRIPYSKRRIVYNRREQAKNKQGLNRIRLVVDGRGRCIKCRRDRIRMSVIGRTDREELDPTITEVTPWGHQIKGHDPHEQCRVGIVMLDQRTLGRLDY